MSLGPIIAGDKSILEHDLTHATSGLALYPAFDAGWREGDAVIAPERVKVTRHSGGPSAGYSFYADGLDSKLRYYVTHLRSTRAAVGTILAPGGRLGTVGNFEGARVPHAHVGVNAEALLGAGKQLKHNTNYTHGQPTIGQQLPQLSEPKEVDPLDPRFPAWFNWYLNGRVEGKPRPDSTAGLTITQPMWDTVRIAAAYRNDKPDGSAEVSLLKGKLANIHGISRP